MSTFRSRLGLALVAGFLPAILCAQSNNGSFSGRVTNADGSAPKAGVRVKAVAIGTNLTRTTVTDSDGAFRIPALPVGEYKVYLEAGGVTHTLTRSVNLNLDSGIHFKWPAETGATVTVEAFAAGVERANTNSAEVGVNVDNQVLENLPILDRNVNSAAVLAPGVQIIQGSQVDPTKKAQTYIVSGDGQGRGTNFNVDGADNNSTDVGGIVMPVPFDAIEQFQVVTNQYKAEYGRSNAGFLNMVTKSGTNEFAGLASIQYTNQDLRAMRTDEGTKLANSQTIYALTFTGPIIKDKLFFMASAEMTKSNTLQTFGADAVAEYPSLNNSPNGLDKHNLYVKLDWNAGERWLVSGTYARYYDKSVNQAFSDSLAVGNNVDPSMLGNMKNDVSKYGLKSTLSFANMVWESTANYFNYVNIIRPASTGSPTNGGTWYVNGTDPGGASYNLGEDWLTYQNTGVKRHQWKNELTSVVGAHSIKFGVDLQQTNYPLEQYFYPNVQASAIYLNAGVPFNQAFSASLPVADVGSITWGTPFINPPVCFHGYGIYAQDDWTLSPKLSLYYGIRVDWDTQLDSYKSLDPIYAYIHTANPLLPGFTDQAPSARKYPSPRFQILYKPHGDDDLIFKAGFGQFVASTIDNVLGFSRSMFGPANGASMTLGNNNGTSFLAGQTIGYINGTPIMLPADLTPYNYANNVNTNGLYNGAGLATVLSQVTAQLTPATPQTGGRQLLSSDFSYPITQTVSLGMSMVLDEHSNLDLTLLYSTTNHNTTYGAPTDGSTPQAWSPSPSVYSTFGYWPSLATVQAYNANLPSAQQIQIDQGDYIFYSNQKAVSKQLQVKYAWHKDNFQFLATFVAKDFEATNGGSGSFSATGLPDFNGTGAPYAWQQGPWRKETGTEPFSGSFSVAYKFDFGTRVSFLGQWHSGKYYDIYMADTTPYFPWPLEGPGAGNTRANADMPIGTAQGSSVMDIGMRISHDFKFSRKMVLEPFIQIQNLLNNYDYGTSYHNGAFLAANGVISNTPDPSLGQRLPAFQVNTPRQAALGAKFNF